MEMYVLMHGEHTVEISILFEENFYGKHHSLHPTLRHHLSR